MGRLRIVAVICATGLLLAACGSSSSSGQAQSLLRQTFSGTHTVKSGVLGFALTVTPGGSSTFTTPLSLSLSGPFQSPGGGSLPQSKLSLSINALGRHGQLGIVSTGKEGFLTLDGVAYRLPAADFQKLESSFAGATGGAGTGGLGKLGIDPLRWLKDPTVAGHGTVGGAPTTHVHAEVNVGALLDDLSTFLQKQAAASATLARGISPATRQRLAASVKHASVDVWTGTSDKTLRRLSVNLEAPVTGQYSTLLGGLKTASLSLVLQYADLNQPQTVSAPANPQPFAGFAAKLRTIVGSLRSTLGLGGLSSSGASGGASTTNSAGIGRYSKCLKKAGNDVTKMQKCASLINSGG